MGEPGFVADAPSFSSRRRRSRERVCARKSDNFVVERAKKDLGITLDWIQSNVQGTGANTVNLKSKTAKKTAKEVRKGLDEVEKASIRGRSAVRLGAGVLVTVLHSLVEGAKSLGASIRNEFTLGSGEQTTTEEDHELMLVDHAEKLQSWFPARNENRADKSLMRSFQWQVLSKTSRKLLDPDGLIQLLNVRRQEYKLSMKECVENAKKGLAFYRAQQVVKAAKNAAKLASAQIPANLQMDQVLAKLEKVPPKLEKSSSADGERSRRIALRPPLPVNEKLIDFGSGAWAEKGTQNTPLAAVGDVTIPVVGAGMNVLSNLIGAAFGTVVDIVQAQNSRVLPLYLMSFEGPTRSATLSNPLVKDLFSMHLARGQPKLSNYSRQGSTGAMVRPRRAAKDQREMQKGGLWEELNSAVQKALNSESAKTDGVKGKVSLVSVNEHDATKEVLDASAYSVPMDSSHLTPPLHLALLALLDDGLYTVEQVSTLATSRILRIGFQIDAVDHVELLVTFQDYYEDNYLI
uniref:Uncharacterized protein n=1 Tax=Rhodosorus marinus TaxID=101924 RepID=A0A7S3EHJ4_9RHOD|mmetsp:Transcript_36479/g.145843  ORF Transcript_36479/g.145843 Transcript_36479/m.145843 type:complete len:519 (+) Transcript_36479:419-1975(+)